MISINITYKIDNLVTHKKIKTEIKTPERTTHIIKNVDRVINLELESREISSTKLIGI